MVYDRPNILLLFSDEHSFRFMGHVSEAAGGEPCDTPTLDRLAAQGTVFTDTYCPMPLCTPSRLCMLTGRHVRGAGAWTNASVLRPGLPTLPGLLVDAGYETALVGKMHMGGRVQFGGFRHRPYGDLTGKCGHQWEPVDCDGNHTMRLRTAGAGVTGIPASLIQDEVVATETVAWVREQTHANPNQPWMACASFSRPHFPLTAPRRHFDRYWPDHVTEPKVPAGGDAFDHPMSVAMREGFQADEISHEEMMRARAAYFACVSYLDEVIGDMLMRLDASGLLDNTIIVYTSDHGELAGEHGVWWKNAWYEGCTRIPLIVSTPEQRSGRDADRACSTPVSLIDLLPTLCSLTGTSYPDDIDGVDLSAAVRGQAGAPERPIFCDELVARWGVEYRSIRWRDYKYVRFRGAPDLLFNLADDPGEQTNLIDTATGDAKGALAYLRQVADESIDFDAAQRDREQRDGGLAEQYRSDLPPSTGNLYVMPSGQVINADDPIYHPTIISLNAAQAFVDWPGTPAGR